MVTRPGGGCPTPEPWSPHSPNTVGSATTDFNVGLHSVDSADVVDLVDENGNIAPQQQLDDDLGSDLEDEGEEFDEVDDGNLAGYGGPYSAHGGYGTKINLGSGRADTLLDFIDEVSDGISSYLGYLEERQRGVVYDRHERVECARWREAVRRIHSDANARAQTEIQPEDYRAGFGALWQPCTPPSNVVFTHPNPLPDGRRRLAFSACFESGNLALAKSDTPTTYTLLLDFDVNTSGYTQWFYFGVQGGQQDLCVTFRIANMSKSSSLFGSEAGMRPVVWSERSGRGWQRGCSDVCYYPNEHRRSSTSTRAAACHTLEFTYKFEFDNDTVFFAYHYPYTYTHLQGLLSWLTVHPQASKYLRRDTLCRTIGGVACDILEIGEPREPDAPEKPYAVATARVHPGESNASWMMQGFLQFLCSSAPEAQALREACTWLVVPMLNPDGVIQGNYRCGLAGADLNRKFAQPHRRLNPTIWNLKERLRGRRIDVYFDLHGHSKREGVFLYGGHYPCDYERNAQIRLLPRLCSVISDDFKYHRSVFSVQDSKLTTARLVAFLQLGVMQAYTVEASFAGGGPHDLEEVASANSAAVTGAVAVGRPPPMPSVGLPGSRTAGRARRPSHGGPAKRRKNSVSSQRSHSSSATEEDVTRTVLQWQISNDSNSSAGLSQSPGDLTPPNPLTQVEAERDNFTPARLELVGPTLLRALAADWSLLKGLPRPHSTEEDVSTSQLGLLEAYEMAEWSHIHYGRLTMKVTRNEFAQLLAKKEDLQIEQRGMDPNSPQSADDVGSDSEPSGDEKPREELNTIHRRLLAKLRRRRCRRPAPEPKQEEPEIVYRTVVAFGRALRIPVAPGPKARFAGEKFDSSKTAPCASSVSEELVPGRPRSAPSGAAILATTRPTDESLMSGATSLALKADDGDAAVAGTSRPGSVAAGRRSVVRGKLEGSRPRPLQVRTVWSTTGDLNLDGAGGGCRGDDGVRRPSGAGATPAFVDYSYGPSDVRSFMEVKSIKPERTRVNQRIATQLKQRNCSPGGTCRDWPHGESAAPSSSNTAYELPVPTGRSVCRRSCGSALHRVPLTPSPATGMAAGVLHRVGTQSPPLSSESAMARPLVRPSVTSERVPLREYGSDSIGACTGTSLERDNHASATGTCEDTSPSGSSPRGPVFPRRSRSDTNSSSGSAASPKDSNEHFLDKDPVKESHNHRPGSHPSAPDVTADVPPWPSGCRTTLDAGVASSELAGGDCRKGLPSATAGNFRDFVIQQEADPFEVDALQAATMSAAPFSAALLAGTTLSSLLSITPARLRMPVHSAVSDEAKSLVSAVSSPVRAPAKAPMIPPVRIRETPLRRRPRSTDVGGVSSGGCRTPLAGARGAGGVGAISAAESVPSGSKRQSRPNSSGRDTATPVQHAQSQRAPPERAPDALTCAAGLPRSSARTPRVVVGSRTRPAVYQHVAP